MQKDKDTELPSQSRHLHQNHPPPHHHNQQQQRQHQQQYQHQYQHQYQQQHQQPTMISSTYKGYIPPTLEELIRSCYPDHCAESCSLKSNTNKDTLPYQHYFSSENFKEFVLQAHCYENLEFLIDIHRYETLWNQIYAKNSNCLSCSHKNVSLSGQATPTSIATPKPTINDIRRSSIPSEVHSISMEKPTNTDKSSAKRDSGSQDDGLPIQHVGIKKHHTDSDSQSHVDTSNLTTSLQNMSHVESFVNLQQYQVESNLPRKKNCLEPASSSSPSPNNLIGHTTSGIFDFNDAKTCKPTRSDSAKEQSICKEELARLWDKIINNYIKEDSIDQINLPNPVTEAILNEDRNGDISNEFHKPNALLKAKKQVYLLLQENVYSNFIEMIEMKVEQDKLQSKTDNSPKLPELSSQSTTLSQPMLSKGPCGIPNPELLINRGPCGIPNPELLINRGHSGVIRTTPSSSLNPFSRQNLPFSIDNHHRPHFRHRNSRNSIDSQISLSSSSLNDNPQADQVTKKSSLFGNVRGIRPLRSRLKKKKPTSTSGTNGLLGLKSNPSSNGSSRRYSSSSAASTGSSASQPQSPTMHAAMDKTQGLFTKLSLIDSVTNGSTSSHNFGQISSDTINEE